MTKDFTVLVDMDDTIEDLLGAWLYYLNDKYGCHVCECDVTDWDMKKFFPSLTGSEIYAPLYDDYFWRTVSPKVDAIKYVDLLSREGFNIYICTNSNFETIASKIKHILSPYFPCISYDHIIIAKDKQMILADVLVDDAPHNLINGYYNKILFTATHNKCIDEKAYGFIRCDNWEEVYNQIHSLYNIKFGS